MMRRRVLRLVAGFAVILGLAGPSLAWADSAALILSGVPGSPEHETRFQEWTARTRTALVDQFGFAEENVTVLENRGARAEDIRSAFSELSGHLGPDDTFFLFLIGHGAYDRDEYKFNIMGADLTAADYDEMLSALPAGRTVIINGTSSSGAAIEALAGDNRVIVTATRTGTERLDPLFYDYFLTTLADEAADEDKNQRLSIWEAFRYTTLAVERFYEQEGRLATEHPQISEAGKEPTGAEPEENPVLAQTIHFNRDAALTVSDPVLRGLLEERRQLEADIDALRVVESALGPEEFNSRLEELLIELALKNQEIRQLEQEQESSEPQGEAEASPAEDVEPGEASPAEDVPQDEEQ